MDFIKRDNIRFAKLTRYRGSHQALVQARTLTRCSRKSNIFIFLSGGDLFMSVHLFFEFLTAFVGTIAFALLFQVPKEYYVNCGLAGGCGWVCYKLLLAGCGLFGSTFFATVLVVFLSRLSAVRRHCPVTIFLVAGIFPLVPGAGIYWTAYYVVTDQLAKASDRGFQTLKIAVAIVLGILFVFEFPQKWFRWAERGTAAGN